MTRARSLGLRLEQDPATALLALRRAAEGDIAAATAAAFVALGF